MGRFRNVISSHYNQVKFMRCVFISYNADKETIDDIDALILRIEALYKYVESTTNLDTAHITAEMEWFKKESEDILDLIDKEVWKKEMKRYKEQQKNNF